MRLDPVDLLVEAVMHDCRRQWCDTPHYDTDDHSSDCDCEACHQSHSWRDWNVYPECHYCELDMLEELAPLIAEAEGVPL